MSRPSQREALDGIPEEEEQQQQREELPAAEQQPDELAVEQQQQQQQQQPELRRVEVCVEIVTRAVSTTSPGGTRRASATTTIIVDGVEVTGEGQEQEHAVVAAAEPEAPKAEEEEASPVRLVEAHLPPPLRPEPVNWVIADGRRGALETEPAKSNLARTHTLQGVAERLRERCHTEGHQLLRLQQEVASAGGGRALDAVRLWLLERGFQRRLRHHLQLVFREMHLLREAHEHFDQRAIEAGAGCPALILLDQLTDEDCDCTTSGSGSTTPALPAASSLGGPQPDNRRDADVDSPPPAALDSRRVSEAEEAEACDFSGGGPGAAEAATGGGAGGRSSDEEAARRFSPVQWSRDRYEKIRAKGSSDSSSSGSDGLLGPGRDLQDTNPGSADNAASSVVIHTAVEESEACAAMEVFHELQRQFQQLADTLRQHALVADGVLRQVGQRKQVQAAGAGGGGGPPKQQPQQQQQQQQEAQQLQQPKPEGQQQQLPEGQPPATQQLLLHEVALLHSEMSRTQASLLRCEVSLQRIVESLPPPPTMQRLPPTPPPPPSPSRPSRLSWFSALVKRRFSRRAK